MAGEEDYFDYSTATNQQLQDNRQLARRMGEDITRYPPPNNTSPYPDPTINFQDEDLEMTDEMQTAWLNDTIERIRKRIMAQDAVVVDQLAWQWWEVKLVLDDARERVLSASTKLKEGKDGSGGWTGAGADAFLARGPGATIKSIDDWETAAVNNWLGLLSLAGVIRDRQAEMEELYRQYKEDMVAVSERELSWYGVESERELQGTPAADDYIDTLRQESWLYNERAQTLQYNMAQDYYQVMRDDLAGGSATVYEGPTDAVVANPDFIQRYMMNQFGTPNIGTPNVTQPNIGTPDITQPNITPPRINPPTVDARITDPNINTPDIDAPDVGDIDTPDAVNPNITTPTVVPTITPPVLPPAINTSQLPNGAPVPRQGQVPTAPGQGLMRNLPSAGGPGVLRAGSINPLAGESLPPGLPPGQRGAQAPPPPPQIKRPGGGPNAPMAPQGRGGGRPGDPTSAIPGAPRTAMDGNQFGGPPGTPASPVLRNPRTNTPAPPGTRGGPRRGTPAVPGAPGGGPSTPLRPDAMSPVLNRPQRPASNVPSTPVSRRPSRPEVPGAPLNPLAPPPPPTSSPVVGRARPAGASGRPPEPPSGVMRGRRTAGAGLGVEGQIASRRMANEAEAQRVKNRDEEFERIRALLDREAAWTVETPGGGVLDSGPQQQRAVTPSSEPKPTLGT
ncbi:hypothetical protein [Phytohabitans kaempferiae]|uniref:PPE family domain-containing protein n=1 Tax=Phytohabitans kaempferiae TaxID=1620943 RepID=A0ABV6M9C2_9ACTN